MNSFKFSHCDIQIIHIGLKTFQLVNRFDQKIWIFKIHFFCIVFQKLGQKKKIASFCATMQDKFSLGPLFTSKTIVSTVWKLQDFSVIQILYDINFRESVQNLQNCHFCHFWGYDLVNLEQVFQSSKSAKTHKNQNSKPLNVFKWQILRLQNHNN